jgi:hypothetical protein
MTTPADQEFEDLELHIPEIDPNAPLPDIPCVEHGPVTVYNYGGVPITRITGDITGMPGSKLSQLILEAVALLGMSDTYASDTVVTDTGEALG